MAKRKRGTPIQVYLTDEERKRLRKLERQLSLSASEVVRALIALAAVPPKASAATSADARQLTLVR